MRIVAAFSPTDAPTWGQIGLGPLAIEINLFPVELQASHPPNGFDNTRTAAPTLY